MCSSEDCEKLWFLYKLEGEPKGVSIEQILDEPSGKPSAASSRVYPIRCLTSGSGIVRNGVPYTFDKGYRFMRIVTEGYKRVYKVEWKDVLAILESSERGSAC